MLRRLALLCVLPVALAAAGCGSRQATHGVLGEQATMSRSGATVELDRIDWALRRAQAKLERSSGPAQAQVLALTRATLRREADRLEQTAVPSQLDAKKASLVHALRTFADGGSLASARRALQSLR